MPLQAGTKRRMLAAPASHPPACPRPPTRPPCRQLLGRKRKPPSPQDKERADPAAKAVALEAPLQQQQQTRGRDQRTNHQLPPEIWIPPPHGQGGPGDQNHPYYGAGAAAAAPQGSWPQEPGYPPPYSPAGGASQRQDEQDDLRYNDNPLYPDPHVAIEMQPPPAPPGRSVGASGRQRPGRGGHPPSPSPPAGAGAGWGGPPSPHGGGQQPLSPQQHPMSGMFPYAFYDGGRGHAVGAPVSGMRPAQGLKSKYENVLWGVQND